MLQTQKAIGTDKVKILMDETVKKQESNTKAKLSWLGGLLDAEATFYIDKHPGARAKLGYLLLPMITLPNTDFSLLDYAQTVIERECGVRAWIGPRQSSGLGRKPQKVMVVTRLNALVRFIDIVTPYLNSKVEQAGLIMEFCVSRLTRPHKAPYSEREIEIQRVISRLNHEQDKAILIRQYQDDEAHSARLAGLYEGEGTFTFNVKTSKNTGNIRHIRPQVSFVNSSSRLLEEIRQSLDQMGLPFITSESENPLKIKPCLELRVVNIRRTSRLIRTFRSYMNGEKRTQADLLLRFNAKREDGKRVPYDAEDIWIVNEVRRLNNLGTKRRFRVYSPTTLRSVSLSTAEEMTKSGLHGDMQSTAEMTVPGEKIAE